MGGQILSQKEVDDLISSAMSDSTDFTVDEAEKKPDIVADKKFKRRNSLYINHRSKYQSPVFRKEDVILNPVDNSYAETGKIPVYTLPAFQSE